MKLADRSGRELEEWYARTRFAYFPLFALTLILLTALVLATIWNPEASTSHLLLQIMFSRLFAVFEVLIIASVTYVGVQRWRVRRRLRAIHAEQAAGTYIAPASAYHTEAPNWKTTTVLSLLATTVLYLSVAFVLYKDMWLFWWPNLLLLIFLSIVWVLRRCLPQHIQSKGKGLLFYTWKAFSASILATIFVPWACAIFGISPIAFMEGMSPDVAMGVDTAKLWIVAVIFQLGGLDILILNIDDQEQETDIDSSQQE